MKKSPFGDELRKLRREAKKTLADLANALEVSIVYMSQIERGDRPPPATAAIATLLEEIGKPEKLDQMTTLAAQSRRYVEIAVQDKSQEEVELFASLARRSDEGKLSKELVEQLKALLAKSK